MIGWGIALLGGPIVWAVGHPFAAAVIFGGGALLSFASWRQLHHHGDALAAAYPRASDQQMDDYLKQDVARITARALGQLGLTESDLELIREPGDPLGPLTVSGPVLDPPLRCISGDDGTWRFDTYAVMVICPTFHHVGVYECILNARTGAIRTEEIREYFYDDIALSSLVAHGPVDLRNIGLVQAGLYLPFARTVLHELEIVAASGDRSSIIAKSTAASAGGRDAKLQESGLDRAVEVLRACLRDKKGPAAA